VAIYKNYSPQSFCVSAERINYTPIDFDSVRKEISNEGRIELAEINLPKLGNNSIDEFIIYEYNESKKDIYFRSLDYIYENSKKIFEGLCEMAKDIYDSEDISINIEDIRNQLSVSWIEISLNDKDECIVEIYGGVNNDICDHIAEHRVTAYINCMAEEFDYYSG